MHTKRLWFLVGLLMTVAGAGLGSIGGAHSISDLAQRANLIVLAAASGTYTPGSAATVSLQVSRVVKGDPALAGGVIAASWSGGTGGMIGPLNPVQQAAGAGIWFLQGSPGAWTLLPVTDGAIELSMTFRLARSLDAFACDGWRHRAEHDVLSGFYRSDSKRLRIRSLSVAVRQDRLRD